MPELKDFVFIMKKQQKMRRVKKSSSLSSYVMQELARSEELKLSGEHAKALRIAESLIVDDPGCTEAVEELADNLLSLDKVAEAEKAALHALSLNKESYIAHFIIGFIASKKEDWGKAICHFQISNRNNSNNPETLRCLGWSLFHSGRQQEGISTMHRSLALQENNLETLYNLAACHLQQSAFSEAIHFLQKAAAINPDDARVKELLAIARRLQKTFLENEHLDKI
jgi:tetratricopeptide (TPR) repeat protein